MPDQTTRSVPDMIREARRETLMELARVFDDARRSADGDEARTWETARNVVLWRLRKEEPTP